MSIQYRINKWDEYFENNRSKKVRDLAWVPVPNRHDGENYSMIMAHENGAEIFAAWVLIIQVASKCEPRGTLVRDGGKPHTPKTLSIKTRAPESWFNIALKYLAQETDWLIAEGLAEDCQPPVSQLTPACQATDSTLTPACQPPVSQVTKKEGKELKEEKGTEPVLPISDSDAEKAKAKKPETYHHHARVALHYLNEKTGRHCREVDSNLKPISARLNESGVDIEGVKQMIDRQCQLWKPDAKMCEYLTPQTLFGASNFDKYYSARLVPVKSSPSAAPIGGEFCEGWWNKDPKQMTSKEICAYVDR